MIQVSYYVAESWVRRQGVLQDDVGRANVAGTNRALWLDTEVCWGSQIGISSLKGQGALKIIIANILLEMSTTTLEVLSFQFLETSSLLYQHQFLITKTDKKKQHITQMHTHKYQHHMEASCTLHLPTIIS